MRTYSNTEYVKLNHLDQVIRESVNRAKSAPENPRAALERFESIIDSGIIDIPESKLDDIRSTFQHLITEIDDSVVVLGNYDKGEVDKLEEVKYKLMEEGYDAYLVEELETTRHLAVDQKSYLAMFISQFSILVDEKPSGHLLEYDFARRHSLIQARLIPGRSSSAMTAGSEALGNTTPKDFIYEDSPLERLTDALEWAENFSEQRKADLDAEFDWRADSE